MFRFILPILLVGIAITGFFTYTKPFYKDVLVKREEIVAYNEALDNSKTLEAGRDTLVKKKNDFDLVNVEKLQKLLPDNIDNVRLIIEISNIASPYGMVLKDVRYDATKKEVTPQDSTATTKKIGTSSNTNTSNVSNKDYGIWNLEFSTQGTYDNFLSFTKDLENNLRIVDISSVQFSSSSTGGGANPSSNESYKYSFKIKTYWLKK